MGHARALLVLIEEKQVNAFQKFFEQKLNVREENQMKSKILFAFKVKVFIIEEHLTFQNFFSDKLSKSYN